MLQIAFKGYNNFEDDISAFYDDIIYYEPGYNRMSPIEFQSDKADKIFFLLRKRSDNIGNSFETINAEDFSIKITDVTNGENLEGNIYGSGSEELYISINSNKDMFNYSNRIKVIECSVKENITNNLITFRVYVDDDDKIIAYYQIAEDKVTNRKSNSYLTKNVYLNLDSFSNYYVLLSPFRKLIETDKGKEDFSYPLDTIFYERTKSYNEEEYDFEISKYSHDFLKDVMSLMTVPNYRKAAVLLIDKYIFNNLDKYSDVYINLKVIGKISNLETIFEVKIN